MSAAAVMVPEPAGASLDALVEWLSAERARLDRELLRSGALVLRATPVATTSDFRRLVAAVAEPVDYLGGISPRAKLADKVYESTYFPAHAEIKSHNEMAYLDRWPALICFCCLGPARAGGETTFADGREVLRALRPETRRRLEARKLRYSYTFPSAAKPRAERSVVVAWEEAFATADRGAVERACREVGQSASWGPEGSLTTTSVRAAITAHPRTGEPVWFNQALLRNFGAISPDPVERKQFQWRSRELPGRFSCVYEDGEPIGTAELEDIDRAVAGLEVRLTWAKGDVLLLDNMLSVHGRRPFEGEREVLCVMADWARSPAARHLPRCATAREH